MWHFIHKIFCTVIYYNCNTVTFVILFTFIVIFLINKLFCIMIFVFVTEYKKYTFQN